MADENTTGVPYEQPYPYLRKISTLPAVSVSRDINLSDMLILVQSSTTKKVSVEHLMSRILDLIDAPDAYVLACRNGFEGTLQEWLLSLKGDGVNSEELGWVVGKHQVVEGSMDLDANGEPISFIREGTLPIDEDAFLIYRDINTNKLYTKSVHGTEEKWKSWDGLLDPFTYINEVIGESGDIPTYEANKNTDTPFSTVSIEDPATGTFVYYDYLDGVRDSKTGEFPYRWDPTDFSEYPSLGEVVRFVFGDDRYGKLMFYDGNHFYDYTGVIDYVQKIVNNMNKINAGSASRLQVARVLDIVTNINDDNITDVTSISFDGTSNENFIINKLNGRVIAGDLINVNNIEAAGNLKVNGTTRLIGETTAGKINAESISVSGNAEIGGTLSVHGQATFDENVLMRKSLTIGQNLTVGETINANNLNINNEITAKKVIVSSTSQSDAISYDAASGITGDTTSSFSTGYFFSPGSANNVAMKINKLSAKLIGNDDYVPKATNSATSDVSTKSTLTALGNDLTDMRPLVTAEEASGNQSLHGSTGVKATGDSLIVDGHISVGDYIALTMPNDEFAYGLDIGVNDHGRRILMNPNELDLVNDDNANIAKVDFRDTSAANLVFCKPIQIEKDATLSIGSETTFTGGDIALAANEDTYTTLGTIDAGDGSVTTGEVPRPARFIVYRPSVFNSSVTVYSGITADTVHIRSDSGSGYYARNIAYGTSSTPSDGDVHDGDLYVQYT